MLLSCDKRMRKQAGRMAQRLGTLAALLEDWGFDSQHPYYKRHRGNEVISTQVLHKYTCRQNTHTHKIMKFFKIYKIKM